MSTLPDPLREHLEKLCVQSHAPAYVLVSPGGLVTDFGGDCERYGFGDLVAGTPADDSIPMLHGLLPLEGHPISLRFVLLTGQVYADVHAVPADDGDWLIFLDAGEQADQKQQVQQAMNDLALLRREQDKLLAQVERDRADLQTILDQLDVVTVSVGHDDRVQFVSRRGEELLAQARSDIVGRTWWDAFPFSDKDRHAIAAALAAPDGDTPPLRVQLAAAGARRFWLEIQVRPDPRGPGTRLLYFYDVSDVYDLRALLQNESEFAGIIGISDAMLEVFRLIRELAGIDSTVLIDGETGTGKELTARAIHYGSHRRDQPVVVVNSAGLSDSLINSELFGHRKGAFTGADQDREGLFEAADGGTILLDEIGDIPMNTQTRILRVLEEREVVRIGETQPRNIDIRILAATNKDLDAEVKAGRFRQDLLYRIRVARVTLPPLRERRSDIPVLVEAFLRKAAAATGKAVTDVDAATMKRLKHYAWPGNVRELRNAIEFAIISCRGAVLQPENLPPEIVDRPARPEPARPYDSSSEKERILQALEQTGGNRARAAEILGISRATLYRRMKSCF